MNTMSQWLEQSGAIAINYPPSKLKSLKVGERVYIYHNDQSTTGRLTDEWLIEFTQIGQNEWIGKWLHYDYYADGTTIVSGWEDDLLYYVDSRKAWEHYEDNIYTFFKKDNAKVISPSNTVVERFKEIYR